MNVRRFAAPLLVLCVVARAAVAQQIPGAELTQVFVSRQALQDLAGQLEAAAQSSSFSADLRSRARAQAAQVRERLRDGDFQVGDRIMLRVEGEAGLTDTFTVRGGRELVLPSIGSVPLSGV